MKSLLLFILIVIFSFSDISGQEKIAMEDYNRAVSFRWVNVNKKVFNLFVTPHWFPDSSGVWYVHQGIEDKKYLKISLPGKEKSDLFDHKKLASLLTDSLGEEIKPDSLPISQIEYRSSKELLITVKGKHFTLNTENYSISTQKPKANANENEQESPDKKWQAYLKDYNLFVRSTETGDIKQLSFSGVKGYEYANWYGWDDIMEGEGEDRPLNFQVDWSSDSKWIYTNVYDLRNAQKMYLLDWSIDSLYRAKLLSYYRGSPGDSTMIYEEPVFLNIETGEEVRPGLRGTHINGVSVRWSDTPGKVYLQKQSRGYQNLNIYSFDLNTRQLDTLYAESSSTNIDNFNYSLAEKNGLLFFLSEKSGWRQLYSLDIKTRQEKAVTNGKYYVNSIDRIDEGKKRIFFTASGMDTEHNPYFQNLYKVSYTGNGLTLLTEEDRHHQTSISPDGKYFVDNFSTANIETKTVLRSSKNGKVLKEMARADVSLLAGWSPPEVFTAVAKDGKTLIYGALWKPTYFDPQKKYPIIDHSYTGPHTQMFPKDFRRVLSIGNQSFAELGFVVMMVDGLGSSGRSKEFHNHSYKNLGGNLVDHLGAIQQLGARYKWIDITRVGIFGHSAGGYDAGHAVLAFPDFYKVAVASSADHDHRMEKAWWPEMYMGWPVDSAYHLQSNVTMAGNLKGKLLITHGGIDENVNPSASFKLAEALIRADKQFDMLILPSQRHGYRGDHQKYFTKKRWNYFVEYLLGAVPIWDFKWE